MKHFMPPNRAELTFAGPAHPECLDAIHELMGRLWQAETGVTDTDRMMFTTAVLEVANNIVTHNRARSDVSISLALTADPIALRAEFCDDGSPAAVDLDTAALPGDSAESGRGLAIARMALDELGYERGKEVNRWRLARHRSASSNSPSN